MEESISPERYSLTNLAWARLRGYIQNDLQDIDTTTSLFREALALRPQSHPDHALSVYHLIFALNWRYRKEDTTVAIQESVQLCCKLLPLCPQGTYLRSTGIDSEVDYVIDECNNLPNDASAEGIHLRRVVLELGPLGHQRHPITLANLVIALKLHFHAHGNIDDLEESIQHGREAISLCPEDHPNHSASLHNLASLLQCRFDHQGKPHDLDEAISMHEEVLLLNPIWLRGSNSILDSLGCALNTRFQNYGDVDDINRAVSLHREALALTPPGHPFHDTMLNNLALALAIRYNLRVIEDLDEAIDLYRECLRLKQVHDPTYPTNLYNLSYALCVRFTRTGNIENVEEAIRLCQESLVALPLLHPGRYYSYQWLQEGYLSRFRVHHNPADLSLAVENCRLASKHPTQGFTHRIATALDWVIHAEDHQHDSALEAYQICLELFDNHVMTRSSIISRREAATAFCCAQSLPVDAASCAVRSNDLQRAVELLEQGRGQQWSLASRLRTPLEDLESASPQLAQRLAELSKGLSDAQGSAGSTDRAAADWAATEYRRLARQWEAAVAEIRDIQGFSRFLLPPSYTELQAAARHGPVIILIASQYSCNAIIVPASGEPHHIPLSSITLADLDDLKGRFTRAIQQASHMGLTESRTDLIVLLRIVWDEIMVHIVNVLEHVLKLQRGSRIWLCPTAAFTSIPLHAAHPFQMKADRSGKQPCLEDLYICSYTPTLSALIRSRHMMKNRVPPSFVAIGQGQPRAGKGKALLAVDSELELVHKLVPATANRSTLSGHGATRAGALDALEQNSWVHLACHGKQDHNQPYNSHFVMKDEPLTLLDIMEKDIPHAEFAFLSACHTAAGDKETPDEVIHLAAGLQFSGFKSVVGTLWEVDDAVAKHVVEAFYKNMVKNLKDGSFMDCTKAAWALNRATHAVMTKVPLEQRMVFIHIGV
ncbi:CHAT domain-containing protein [Suillus clintonianus]|uniref:CHAT domain-containing protein n=1 Tax=Suillus clintonianus TaxID=1904413 RepID=UPI001B886D94|nr:CHAT domain-containing protein [Suillus clintonianus]KAG2145206.1 CHAT domain-containing protein [Suillus clintonianus]